MNKRVLILCSTLLAATCHIAQAQETQKLLDDYFLGGAAEQKHVVHEIDELMIARETGRQAVLLSSCKSFKTLDTRRDFDLYAEELQQVLTEKSPTVNALNGFANLSLAAARNEFSDDHIMLIKAQMIKNEYADMMSYIWFEHVMRQASEGLIDVNTEKKQPWVAARALHYLKTHKLYPLFLSTLTVEEKELLNSEVFTSLEPAETIKETQYTEALFQLFDKQLESKALLHALPTETASMIVVVQERINPEEKRALGALSLLGDNATDLVCKSSNKKNCVSNQWFKKTKSTYKINELARFDIAKTLLNKKYRGVCEENFNSSLAK